MEHVTRKNVADRDARRGISGVVAKTAQDRFLRGREGELTANRLQKNSQRKKSPLPNQPKIEGSNVSHNARLGEAFKRIEKIYREAGEPMDANAVEEMTSVSLERPQDPSFPFIILTIAVLKDTFDIAANLVIIGIPISMALSFIMSLILFIWTLGKMSGVWWKKKLVQWMFVWLVIVFIGEETPFIQMLPLATIFVLMAHYREKKIVKLFNAALEELHRMKF